MMPPLTGRAPCWANLLLLLEMMSARTTVCKAYQFSYQKYEYGPWDCCRNQMLCCDMLLKLPLVTARDGSGASALHARIELLSQSIVHQCRDS
jgi:hypothetical protein